MYLARRVAARFFEYIDGWDISTPGDDFNIDAEPHQVEIDDLDFDSMSDLIRAVKRDGVTFDATGADWASDPDGSQIIDYRTAEREVISWHFDNVPRALLFRVIIPAIG